MYSILNPDTNSDSPSEKSKGVRFSSPKNEINIKIIVGKENKKKGVKFWNLSNNEKLNLLSKKIKNKNKSTNLTS